jgi:hypothetical protein
VENLRMGLILFENTLFLLFYYDCLTVRRLFFMPKFKHKEVMKMFNDEFLEKLFTHHEMQKIPVGCIATSVNAFQDVLENIAKENPYATVQSLLESAGNE